MLEKTKELLDHICTHEIFEKYDIRFVGGTAFSYLINHRLSEDLDFAMLDMHKHEIQDMMDSYGAIQVSLEDKLVDDAANDGEDISYHYLKYLLNGVKIEFFIPPFNLLEVRYWDDEPTTFYENSKLKVASLKTLSYMKTMAFWNRKKYRDLFDIYYLLENNLYCPKEFLENYLNCNFTYTKEQLLKKIQSKHDFYLKKNDEGIHTLVDDPKSYDWYRLKIENFVYDEYLKELYS